MTTIPASANHDAATGAVAGGPLRLLRRIEAWLDDKGRMAWIVAMVLGFVFAWPVGLFLVFYITYTKRWSSDRMSACATRRHRNGHGRFDNPYRAPQTSGNQAFDSYRAEMLKRLEDEQTAFEAFLERLREAKDKSEFDAFMQDRARETRAPDSTSATAGTAQPETVARSGEY